MAIQDNCFKTCRWVLKTLDKFSSDSITQELKHCGISNISNGGPQDVLCNTFTIQKVADVMLKTDGFSKRLKNIFHKL